MAETDRTLKKQGVDDHKQQHEIRRDPHIVLDNHLQPVPDAVARRPALRIAAIQRRRVFMLNSLRGPGMFALDAEALSKPTLLDQVSSGQKEVGLAIDECQQACPLTVAFQQFSRCCSRLMGRTILVADRR